MSFYTSYFLLFLYYTCVFKFKIIKSYKISMVSSDSNPGQPEQFTHGESPVWDPERQCLFFVDVLEQNVHRLDYGTGKIHTKHIGYGQVNVLSLVAGANRLLIAVRASMFLMDWSLNGDSALRLLSTVDLGYPDNVINEGKPDAEGRFWAGTKGPQVGLDVISDKATLYSIEQESFTTPRIQLRPLSISNGMAWSLNNTVMYYVDSPTQKVEAFDFDLARGEISGRRTILDITKYGYEDAIPDGMTIDSRGFLWVAIMFGGAVLHIDPDSRTLIHTYKLPVTRITSVMWGGPELDELFLTTSRHLVDRRREPLAGAIFTIRDTGYRGIAPNYFAFDDADSY